MFFANLPACMIGCVDPLPQFLGDFAMLIHQLSAPFMEGRYDGAYTLGHRR